jgi:hypothetical protein
MDFDEYISKFYVDNETHDEVITELEMFKMELYCGKLITNK